MLGIELRLTVCKANTLPIVYLNICTISLHLCRNFSHKFIYESFRENTAFTVFFISKTWLQP